MVELMVVVALIGIASGFVFNVTAQELRRARLNAVQFELAGWLQQVQRRAMRRDLISSGCTVSFKSFAGASSGVEIADVTPSACSPSPSLKISSQFRDSQLFEGGPVGSIVFTSRGFTLYPGNSSDSPSYEYRLSLGGFSSLGCVRIGNLVGQISIGANPSTTSIASQCSTYTEF